MTRNQLLITGAALLSNLKLFSFLSLICPEAFVEYFDLDFLFHECASGSVAEDASLEEEDKTMEEANKKVPEALRKILRPFLLRRVKSDVEKRFLPSEYRFFSPLFNFSGRMLIIFSLPSYTTSS